MVGARQLQASVDGRYDYINCYMDTKEDRILGGVDLVSEDMTAAVSKRLYLYGYTVFHGRKQNK